MKTNYYENGEITTIVNYRFVGYGTDAQAIYRRIITTFSISRGIIRENEPQSVNCFYR